MYRTLNPTTGVTLQSFPLASEQQVEKTLQQAQRAFNVWRQKAVGERAEFLYQVAQHLESQAERFAECMAVEMGKPLAEGVGEVNKCAWVCRFYAEHGEEFLADIPVESDAKQAFIHYQPLGPILAIMPWNFPFWQVFRFAAPALAAGNTVILKHAPNTPRCALAITELFQSLSSVDHLFQNLFLSNAQAETVISDWRVRGVTLTGSTRAGREVAARAGSALKPMVMELGGSDPFIVLADADIERAAAVGAQSRCLNNGQSCIAAKRFLVHDDVYDDFIERLASQMRSRTIGDPLLGHQIGPMARRDLLDQLRDQVARAQKQGGQIVGSPVAVPEQGFFHPPLVMTGLSPDDDVAQEEFFGPVALVFRFNEFKKALSIANGTPFGLGASVWTADRTQADAWIRGLDCGAVFVNGMVKSDPRLPFGGIKQSGFGRELAREGLLEFVNTKTVWVG